MTFTRAELEHFADKERDRFEDLLKDFVEVPSVSADPAHKPDVERCAELGAATLRALGGRAELHRVKGEAPWCWAPSTRARPTRRSPSTTTSTCSRPRRRPSRGERALRVHEGRRHLPRRGTTDDKGPALTALLGAARRSRRASR
jgi:acetylornithine deacetylase/succinyl-diaminopimelate desuccinylase-like protein